MDFYQNDPYQPPQPPTDPQTTPPTVGKRKTLIRIMLGAGAVLLLVGAAFFVFRSTRHSSPPTVPNTTVPVTTSPQPAPVTDATIQHYIANGKDINLTFDYPSIWHTTPPSATDSDDKAISVTSPLVSLNGANGKSTTVKIVISIRPGGSALSELNGDKATAAQPSMQIAYAKPTSAQHQYPFISFAHLTGGTNPAGLFEEILITGATTFMKDQPIVSTSLAQLDPIIGVRFYACTDAECVGASAIPLSIPNGTWMNNATCQQALATLESLQIN